MRTRGGVTGRLTETSDPKGHTTPMTHRHTAVPVPLEWLKSKTITALVDSYQAAFATVYDEECGRTEQARTRLLAELAACDPFIRSTEHQEYRPV